MFGSLSDEVEVKVAAEKAWQMYGTLELADIAAKNILESLEVIEGDGGVGTFVKIESLSLTFHGHDLIVDSELELNYGRRYGLLGLNGCGKSTLLTSIGQRGLPIPEHMDIFHLTREIEASDMSSLEAVMNCDEERLKLEEEAERLIGQNLEFKELAVMTEGYNRSELKVSWLLFGDFDLAFSFRLNVDKWDSYSEMICCSSSSIYLDETAPPTYFLAKIGNFIFSW
ncbi:ABC transporter family protein [Artemisia annua]|uniref:ABC transporter family protein n=1 Tax=Artemisia annua TaxID=35608 RepID=A0A2U1KQW0_ARTAN|nr:ABC transporter family protein [Artemisia annua]